MPMAEIDITTGCGDIRLGSSLNDILDKYGEPEKMSGGITTEYYRGLKRDGVVTKLDTWQKNEDVWIFYMEKYGFHCIFDYNSKRMRFVAFYSNFNSFKTKEGINSNSTIEDVKRIYGQPKKEHKGMIINNCQLSNRILYANSDFLFEDQNLVGKLKLTKIGISDRLID